MAKRGVKLGIKPIGMFKEFAQLASEAHDRSRAAQRVIARSLGDRMLEQARLKIPDDGGMLTMYRDALKVRDILGLREDEFAVLVSGEASTEFESMDAEKIVVVFRPVPGAREKRSASILRRYGPWAVDTIPAVKQGIRANAILKVASPREIGEIREKNRKELPLVLALLKRAGFSVTTEAPVLNGRALIDLAFLALRLEKGLGGFEPTPHWTPAVLNIRSRGLRDLHSDAQTAKMITRTLLDHKFFGWSREFAVEEDTPKGSVKDNEEFVKRAELS